MIYRIYPPLGIARLGNSLTEFFIASEVPGAPATELQPDGTETPVQEYKTGDTGDPSTSFQVKRQAARFRLYEFDDAGGTGRPAVLPEGATVQWSVHLVNKKDAVERPPSPPVSAPATITLADGRGNRIIDSGAQTIGGASAPAKALGGTYLGNPVTLGQLRTDHRGNLLVLAGTGVSKTFENASIGVDFYNNPNWFDDVADGPVTATITFADGNTETVRAWVVTAPPDFAPAVEPVVTLYDTILQAAKVAGLAKLPAQPSFTHDILTIIRRARGLRWVHDDAAWPGISGNFAALSDTSAAAATRRQNAVRGVLHIEAAFTHPDYTFRLRAWQKEYLEKFRLGNFVADFGTAAAPDPASPEVLTRTILDGAVGEGFFPGIEAGIMLTKTSLYSSPFEFRLDHTKVAAGDLTALMALPWQADFFKCDLGWWPSQRPNKIPHAPPRPEWDRGISDHSDLVKRVMMLGVITPRASQGGQEVQEESRRHSSMP
ncbi:MAG TPA: LodA/GoxA family CTQ-dependent oxidase [Chthoniobacterales bacterium]|nr:LodA/GoxA family CTQ-dependent oxidase [Chthoniobacterales bacterium]